MRNTFKLLFIITTLSFSLFNAHALTKQDIAEKALNSTVVVVVEDKQGNTLQFGSGFIIDGGMVVSNHHVVSGGFSGYVIHNDKAFKILGTLGLDDKNDLVLLKIDKHKIPPLSIYKGSDLKVGANVFVAGNPLGMSGTFSEGMLSSIRNIKGKELYQITAPISQGSSGGPVLNDNGTVIGVVVSLLGEGQNINFAVPNTYLNSLINNKGSLTPLSSITPKSAEVIEPQVINTKPIINEEGKLTDICCAFGVELGKKLNPELSRLSSELRPHFTPENPYEGFNSYKVYLVDKDSFIYKIQAEGNFGNKEYCQNEMSILFDIFKDKYKLKHKVFHRSWNFGRFKNKVMEMTSGKRRITLSCGFIYTGRLTLTYEDFELKELADKIHKEKLSSPKNSSGI